MSIAKQTDTPATPSSRAPLWAWAVATFLGVGKLKPGPGTWASLATVGLWGFLGEYVPVTLRMTVAGLIAIAVTLVGIPAATLVARASQKKDPSIVVIDEVAGQMIALIGVPLRWPMLLVGLILFRVFDMVKPTPVRELERLPEGSGIVLDDVAAGLYALIVIHIVLRIWG